MDNLEFTKFLEYLHIRENKLLIQAESQDDTLAITQFSHAMETIEKIAANLYVLEDSRLEDIILKTDAKRFFRTHEILLEVSRYVIGLERENSGTNHGKNF